MSDLYSDEHRGLQDKFQTRQLADTVEAIVVNSEISDLDKAFIESRDIFPKYYRSPR